MYVCVCAPMSVFYVHTYGCICICVPACMFDWVYVCACVRISQCIYAYSYVHTFVYFHVYVCMCITLLRNLCSCVGVYEYVYVRIFFSFKCVYVRLLEISTWRTWNRNMSWLTAGNEDVWKESKQKWFYSLILWGFFLLLSTFSFFSLSPCYINIEEFYLLLHSPFFFIYAQVGYNRNDFRKTMLTKNVRVT